MEPKGLFLCTQESASSPNHETYKYRIPFQAVSLRPIWILSINLCIGHQSVFPFSSSELAISSMHATFPTHLISLYFVILGEEYIAWRCKLCTFVHPAATSSHLGPDFFLSIPFSNTSNISVVPIKWETVSHRYTVTSIFTSMYFIYRRHYSWVASCHSSRDWSHKSWKCTRSCTGFHQTHVDRNREK
jgi:hypothetical protein